MDVTAVGPPSLRTSRFAVRSAVRSVTLAAASRTLCAASCGSTELVPSALPDGTAGAPAVEGVRDEDREAPVLAGRPGALLADLRRVPLLRGPGGGSSWSH